VIVGVDLRPALLSTTGVARAARQCYLALRDRPELTVRGFGASWARPRYGADLPDVVAPRLPGRLAAWMAPLGFSVETLMGRLDVFQHTDLVFPPVRRAAQVLFVHDLLFLGPSQGVASRVSTSGGAAASAAGAPREGAGRGWHDPGFAERVGPRLFARAAEAAAVVVPHTRVADDALRLGLVEPERLVVLPLGLDHVSPRPEPDDEQRVAAVMARAGLPRRSGDELLVLVPGTREPRKNQLALLHAFMRLPVGLGARLLLVGPAGWGCPELERVLLDRACLRDERGEARVAAAGEVSEPDLAALMRRADVVAYPSLAEGYGLPALEAMALGRAVLTSRGTPMGDLGGDAALCIDPTDPSSLERGLSELLRDASLRAVLSNAAPARVAGLTWASHAEGLSRVYQAVLA